jgi:hypothetical protein
VGSVSKRYSTKNNNTMEACVTFDNYGGTSSQSNCGVYKPYANNHLVVRGGTSAIFKAGVEYMWIAVEDGV